MGNNLDSDDPDDLRVLNDVRFFNISSGRWTPSPSSASQAPESLVPKPRYAHLSSVTSNRLFIIGGQDLSNAWLDDIYVYDLLGKAWVQRKSCSRHCGTYRSIAVSSDKCTRLPQEERLASRSPSRLGPPGTRFKSGKNSPHSSNYTSSESLIHLPYTAEPTEEYPNNIYLYSNYNVSCLHSGYRFLLTCSN
jgi:leucine-zipper-like transcriptional regulator 1